jgi:hypothetical protein
MRILVVLALAGLGMPAQAEELPPPELEFVFEEIVKLGPATEVGETALGKRRIIPIVGGRFEGPNIKGEVLSGGWDWQLERADGCTEVEADYFLKTDDGVVINVVNVGALCPPVAGVPGRAGTHPTFEPPLGKYEWLGKQAFVGTLELAPPSEGAAVRIKFYRVK